MKKSRCSIVVIGASAGGLEALTQLLGSLPADFPAAVFVVKHMPADVAGHALHRNLNRKGTLACEYARDGEPIVPGRIYVAPPDNHLLLSKTKIVISKGARENRSRPGIDPLFRSAAVAFGSRVIGVILTGYLDDGTAGLIAIHRCGGICVVQDPRDAAYPDMPQNALNNATIDHCLPLAQLGPLLTTLVRRPLAKQIPVPQDIVLEAKIADRVLSDVTAVESLGKQVPFNCPNCGGVLWEMAQGKQLRYRCHTGHAFSASVLMAEQTKKIEETLWIALRMFEERRNLLVTLSDPARKGQSSSAAERLRDSEMHIERIRNIILSGSEIAIEAPTKPRRAKFRSIKR